MKIKSAALGFAALSLVVMGTSACLLWFVYDRVNQGAEQEEVVSAFRSDVALLSSVTSDYLLFREERSVRQWRQKHAGLDRSIQGLQDGLDDRARQQYIEKMHHSVGRTFDKLQGAGQNSDHERQLASQLFLEILQLQNEARTLGTEVGVRISKANDLLALVVPIAFGAMASMVLAGLFFVFRRILKPLSLQQATIARVAAGESVGEIDSGLRDEFGDLANIFRMLVEKKNKAEEFLEAANKQLLANTLELTASRARLARAETISHVGNWSYRVDGGVIEWSEELWRIFGREPDSEKLTYEAFTSWIRDDYREYHDKMMEKMLGLRPGDDLGEFIYCVVRPSGEHRWVQVFMDVEFDPDGSPSLFFGVVQDITERREDEEKIKKLAEEFQGTFEQAAVGIAHVGLDGSWLRVNRKLCDIIGYRQEELREKTFQDITHPDDLEEDLVNIEELVRGDADTYTMEKRCIRKDRCEVWVNLTVAVVRSEAGQPRYFISVVEDIGYRKEAEAIMEALAKKLARSNEELENFAYVASHDLKAPLRGIKNLVKLLTKEMSGRLSEKAERHLSLMENRSDRMQALLEALLQYSRVGRQESDVSDVDLGQMVLDVAALLSLPKKFTVRIDDDMPSLTTERAPLEMVIRNLIGNAIKHHDQGKGRVEISAFERGEFVEIAVRDDGPGIPAEFHDRVFGIFQTLRSRDEVEGSGMGLALVKKAVEHQGGNVTITSDPKTKRGTAFVFTWPTGRQMEREKLI